MMLVFSYLSFKGRFENLVVETFSSTIGRKLPLFFVVPGSTISDMRKKFAKSQKPAKTAVATRKRLGNIFDAFAKQMFGQILVFTDFLVNYAEPQFVSKIDLKKITPAPTHYISPDGNERILDLVFRCPLKNGKSNTMAVIIFEHQSGNLKKIPLKLLKYIAAIWVAEAKEGFPLSAPYFIVLRTGKKQHKSQLPRLTDLLPKDEDGKLVGKMIEIEYDVVDLPAWDFKKLVGGPVLRLAIGMLKKMTEGKEDEFSEAMLPLLEIPDVEERLDLTKVLLELAAKVMGSHNLPFEKEAVKKALEPIYKDGEEIETMIETIFDKKFAEGVAVGEARGEAKGVAEEKERGEAKALQVQAEMLLTFVRSRFGKVPKAVEQKIRKTKDKVVLESWAAHAGSCHTVKEFEETVL